MASGLTPLNVQITPDGKLAIVNNIGGGQDGQVDTVGVIDLEASPPRVVDQVVVGDGPEGLAMSPAGGYATSLILNGTGGTLLFSLIGGSLLVAKMKISRRVRYSLD
jgi:DNA-binding beta-propeller fold protein YncE